MPIFGGAGAGGVHGIVTAVADLPFAQFFVIKRASPLQDDGGDLAAVSSDVSLEPRWDVCVGLSWGRQHDGQANEESEAE